MKRCTYLLPIRRSIFRETEGAELRNYLSILAGNCELIMIDGSPSEIFEKHHRIWSNVSRHEAVAYWAFYWYLTRRGYPFGDRLLAKGIGRDWVEDGRIAASSSSRQ